MVLVSLGLHLIVFFHIAGLYHSNSTRVIEVSVQDDKPVQRSIPQPRVRHEMPKTKEINQIHVDKQRVPEMQTEPVEADYPDTITEEIARPDVSGLSAEAADWQPLSAGSSKYLTRGEYFDMLRLKIQSRKEYPASAQQRQLQGQVVVGFTVDTDGGVTAAEVVESSGHRSLDRAAIRAVKNSAPFPRPPASLFDGALKMKITIVFELT